MLGDSDESDLAPSAAVEDATSGLRTDETADVTGKAAAVVLAIDASTDDVALMASSCLRRAWSDEKSGMNRVHQNARRRLRSITRSLRIKSTTTKKKAREANINILSIQSAFSSAVMSCFDVPMTLDNVSWVEDVARREAVELSVIELAVIIRSNRGVRT